jgi:hypothetical protein
MRSLLLLLTTSLLVDLADDGIADSLELFQLFVVFFLLGVGVLR